MKVKQSFMDTFHLFNHRPRTFTHPILITLLYGLIFAIFHYFYQYSDVWGTFRDAVGNATLFCELNRFGQFVVQPSNTYSNLGFLYVACVILSIAYRDHKYTERHKVGNLLSQYPAFSFLIGFSTLILFLGSFFYHASLTWGFQKLDQNGMYFVITAFLSYNIFRLIPIIRKKDETEVSSHKTIIFASLVLMVLFYTFIWKINIMILFPALVIIFYITNILCNRMMKNKSKSFSLMLRLLVVTFLTASFIWIMDITDVMCIPTSIFQGHALWHFLCAAAILITYLYYRGERFMFIYFSDEK